MKFLITSGRKKGFAFEVIDKEVFIGRKKENDILLDDESVSGRHGRIHPKGDEVLIEDCDSVNGIELNGKPVKKTPLHPGDVIAIGMTQITVVAEEEKNEAETKPAEETKEEPEEKSFRSSRLSKEKGGDNQVKRPSSKGKLVVAIVLVALVIALAGAIPFLRKMLRPSPSRFTPAGGSPTDFTRMFFRLRYEKVEASPKNIFRYEMQIENGTLTMVIDDLKQERHLRRNKSLEPNAIARIRSAIQDQQIFSLPAQIEGKSAEMWDSSTLEIVADGQFHRVHVLNRLPPDNFKKVCNQLEDFGEKELNVAGFSLSSEELKKRAQETFQRARQLSEQRSVKAENLFNAIKAFGEAIWYLETIEPKPPLYAEAIKAKQEASDALGEQIKDHQFRSTRAIQLKEWRSAAMELRQLLEKLPDQADKRYQDAQVQLLDVERHLQSR